MMRGLDTTVRRIRRKGFRGPGGFPLFFVNLFKSIELPVERFQCFLHRFSEFLFNGGEFAEGQNLSAAGFQFVGE